MNYGNQLMRIATDLGNRQDLLAPVAPSTLAVIPQHAIDRIGFHAKGLFAPSEILDYSITTVAAQNIYRLPRGMQSLLNIKLLIGNIWLPLARRPYEYILNVDLVEPPFVSIPGEFGQWGETFRLFPTPDRAYPLELMGNIAPPPPVSPTDENFWTDEGATGAGMLIVYSTCADIMRTFINNPQRADQFDVLTNREAPALRDYTARLAGPLRMEPYI